MINKKRLIVVVLVVLCAFSVSALAYTGVLDTFSAWDVSNGGVNTLDTWDITDGDMYVKVKITDSTSWPDNPEVDPLYTSVLVISAQKKGFLGFWSTQSTKSLSQVCYYPYYSYKSFTGLASGEYRLHMSCGYLYELMDFNGTVYDDN